MWAACFKYIISKSFKLRRISPGHHNENVCVLQLLTEWKNLSSAVVGTHRIEDRTLVSKAKGTFAHRDVSAVYKEDGKYRGLLYEASIEISALFRSS